MDKKRREFLKIAGISTLAGLGAPAVVDRIVAGSSPLIAKATEGGSHEPAESHAAPAEHSTEVKKTGKRYGMVIDVRKFYENPAMAEACVKACHKVHNVPHFPDKKDEIKWLWQTGYENAFTEHSNDYSDEETENKQVLVL